MNENPSYYSIIPADVRYDKRLTPNAKLLYAEITCLSHKTGICTASNEYFANLYNVSKVSISKWISQLVEFEYIEAEIIYKEGTKQILNRYLSLVKHPIKEKFNTPIKEKFKDNIYINNNNILNNNILDNNILNNNILDNNILNTDSNIKKDSLFDLKNKKESKKEKRKISENEITDFETLFTYWEENKRGVKYKPASRERMFRKLKDISKNDLTTAKNAVFFAIDNGYMTFCDGSSFFYKTPLETKKNGVNFKDNLFCNDEGVPY